MGIRPLGIKGNHGLDDLIRGQDTGRGLDDLNQVNPPGTASAEACVQAALFI